MVIKGDENQSTLVNMVYESSGILNTFAMKLHEIDALKFETIQKESGLQPSIYFDLCVIISHPDVMVIK